MNIRLLFMATAATCCFTVASAQDNSDKLTIKTTGRALFDAATYGQNDQSKEQDGEMNDGVGVRDIRIGLKGYYKNWYFRGELSYTNNKVSAKDIFLRYSFNNNNNLQVGHYTVPFGLSSAYSSSKKEYMDEPEGNVFQVGRRIGIMHTLYNHNFWGAYGAFADNSALTQSTDKSGKQGYTLAGRFVWRPIMNDDYGFHVGFSANHVGAESNSLSHRHIAYSKTYLTSVDKRKATNIDVLDARWENKFTAEFQGIYRNWQLASQYYWSHIGRDNDQSYNTNGFYVSARGIIVNPANYKYNYAGSGVDNPSDKNLELMLGYGFLNLKDGDALSKYKTTEELTAVGLANAARMSDVSAGLSFFWNKYVTLRLNYHYIHSHTWNQPDAKVVNVLQMRVQYMF